MNRSEQSFPMVRLARRPDLPERPLVVIGHEVAVDVERVRAYACCRGYRPPPAGQGPIMEVHRDR